MNDITAIVEVPHLQGTPARVNHRTGVMEVSRSHFKKLDPVYRLFVMYHERGHLVLNTKNEREADNYAMNELLKKGYPLTKILESLTKVLQYDKQDHYGRTLALLNKLRSYDYHINGNKKVLTQFNSNSIMNTPNLYAGDVYDKAFQGEHSNFLGALLGGLPIVGDLVNNVLGGLGGGGNNAAAAQAQAAAAAQAQALQMMQMQQAANNKNEPGFMEKNGTIVIIAVVLVVIIIAFLMMRKK